MKKGFLVLGLAVFVTMFLMVSILTAGVGKRYTLLIPAGVAATSDSTLASLSLPTRALDLSLYNDIKAIKWWVGVTTADTDMDSVSYLMRLSPDGTNWITVNEDVNTASTVAGTQWGGQYTSDSLYFGLKYFQIIARTCGDDAGSAIQTIYFTPTAATVNGLGEITRWLYGTKVESSFQE